VTPGYGWRVPRLSDSWTRLVALSAVVVAGTVIAMAVWWASSRETVVSSFAVRGELTGVELDAGGAAVDIVGGGAEPVLRARRDERYAFGHRPRVERRVDGGVLRLHVRCPHSLPRTCSASYRLQVPDNVPVTVRTSDGDVRFARFNGSAQVSTGAGDVDVGTFCGFLLTVRTESGNVRASTACPLERLTLRSRSGDVRALVPRGRYRVDAESDSGTSVVAGVEPVEDSPYTLQALSNGGDVRVEALR
jgi:hypothetical protein